MWLFIKLQPLNDIIVDQCNCDEKMNFKKKVVSAKLDVIGWSVWIGLWCWPSHFKWFKLQQKLKRNLKSDPSYHLLKKALKKVPMIAWETSLINGCTHTRTLTLELYTQREICNHVLEGKKLIKRFKLQQKLNEEKPQKVLIIASFEGDDEKAYYASFKHVFI